MTNCWFVLKKIKFTSGKQLMVRLHIAFLLQADKIHKLIMILHTNLYKVPIQQASFSILHMTVQMLSTKFLKRRMGFIGSNYLEMFQKRYFYISAMLAAFYDHDKVYDVALQHFFL